MSARIRRASPARRQSRCCTFSTCYERSLQRQDGSRMGSSCMQDDIECPQCEHPACLKIESTTCHDWNELACPFWGYSEESDFDDPDNVETTTRPGVGVLAFSRSDWLQYRRIAALAAETKETDYANALCTQDQCSPLGSDRILLCRSARWPENSHHPGTHTQGCRRRPGYHRQRKRVGNDSIGVQGRGDLSESLVFPTTATISKGGMCRQSVLVMDV